MVLQFLVWITEKVVQFKIAGMVSGYFIGNLIWNIFEIPTFLLYLVSTMNYTSAVVRI